jgi:transposase
MDVHSVKTMLFWVRTDTGETSETYEVLTAELLAHVPGLPDGRKVVVLEAGTQSSFLARRLRTLGCEVHVVDPFKVRRLFEALYGLKKTDKIDAQGLALAWADGFLRSMEVWVADAQVVALRELTRARQLLVEQNAQLRTAIRQLLARENLRCPYSDLLGVKAQAWLEGILEQLPADAAAALRSYLDVLQTLAGQIEALTARITEQVRDNEDVALLQTIPGIGMPLAAAIVAEIGDVRRFESANQLRGYSGLVPRVYQSGERTRTGPLTKRGNRRLRRSLILSAQHFIQSRQLHDSSLRKWYVAQVFRHGRNPAKVAVARRLLTVIFAMLRDRLPFDLKRYLPAKAA